MQLINHRLDYSKPWSLPDLYVFTGSAAKQVRDSWLGFDKNMIDITFYNFVITEINFELKQYIGWFQVKDHWRDQASLALIRHSTETLGTFALSRPHLLIHMNYPGIGNGRLREAEVQPVLETLPDNVRVYK